MEGEGRWSEHQQEVAIRGLERKVDISRTEIEGRGVLSVEPGEGTVVALGSRRLLKQEGGRNYHRLNLMKRHRGAWTGGGGRSRVEEPVLRLELKMVER